MRVVFEGLVWTSYAQMHLETGADLPPLPDRAFLAQANGLCGAAVPGSLFLITGTHTGRVPVRVSVWEAEPPLGDWQEIVEASLTPEDAGAALSGWAEDPAVRFDLPEPHYRVRWNATGMDAGHQHGVADESDPAPDAYELMLWPAPPSADAVLRRTSAQASYWHDHAFTRLR